MGGLKTIGIIGLGSIGMRHAKNLLAMGHTVCGYDPDGKVHGGLDVIYLSEPEYIAERCDAVVIASPTPFHGRQLWDAVVAGTNAVLVEKPIADSSPDYIRGALVAMKDRGSLVMIGNNLRFHSCVKKAKEWLPKIGQPIWANFTCAQHNTKYTDHVLLNWGAHEIDLATYLLGPAQVASCIGTKDIVDVNLLHGNGCRTAVHLDYLSRPELRQHRIIGTEASIEMELAHGRTAVLIPRGDSLAIAESFTGSDSWDKNYIEEMAAFIDHIDGKETLGATGEEGLAVLELILEAKRMAGGD